MLLSLVGYSKDSKTAYVHWDPSTANRNGYVIDIKINYGFANCYGQKSMAIGWGVITSSQYVYNGKKYSAAEVNGNMTFDNIRIGFTTLSADMYEGSHNLGVLNFKYLTNFTEAGCFSDISHFTEMLGINDKDFADSRFAGLTLQNFRNIEISCDDRKVEQILAKKVNDEEYNTSIRIAENLLIGQKYEAARTEYKKALSKNVNNEFCEKKIVEITELIKSKEQNILLNDYLSKGNDALNQKKYSEAKSFYEKALSIDPTNSNIKGKIESIENSILAEKTKNENSASTSSSSGGNSSSTKTVVGNKDSELKLTKQKSTTNKTDSVSEAKVDETKGDEAKGDKKKSDTDEKKKSRGGSGGSATGQSISEMQEHERQRREMDVYQMKAMQNQTNFDMASHLQGQFFEVLFKVGTLMYSGMGNESWVNKYKGNSIHVNFNVGYASTFLPMYYNSVYDSFDGNNTKITKTTEKIDIFTIDLQGGGEAWAFAGDNAGLGVFGNVSAGTGVLFDQFCISSQYGAKGFFGFKNLKVLSEFSFGNRKVTYKPWMDVSETGSGISDYKYTKFSIGPRITWNSNFVGKTRAHLDILPTVELPDFVNLVDGNFPLKSNWLNGLKINLDFENRIKFFTEIMWNYKRSGETLNNISSDIPNTGTFLRIGGLRNFDIFGYDSRSIEYNYIEQIVRKKNKFVLSLFVPSVSWAKSDVFFTSALQVGITPITIEKDFDLFKNLSLFTELSFTFGRGEILQALDKKSFNVGYSAFSGTQSLKINSTLVNLPVGIRINKLLPGKEKVWLKCGLSNQIALGSSISKGYSKKAIFTEIESDESFFKTYRPSSLIGIGIDFPIVDDTVLRVGASYLNNIGDISKINNFVYRENSFMISTGIVF